MFRDLGKKKTSKQSPPLAISSPIGTSPFVPSPSAPYVPHTTYHPPTSNQPRTSVSDRDQFLHTTNSTYSNNSSGGYSSSSGARHGHQSHSGDYSTSSSSPPPSGRYSGSHPSHYSATSYGTNSTATAIANAGAFAAGHHRVSSGVDDAQSIRSQRTSTSGMQSEA
ncbi:hypothetical protein BGZ65_000453, partial [Modicella reniformis]